jgi:MEMO1 family protein
MRAVETALVSDDRLGPVVVLRDTDGVSAAACAVPLPLMALIGEFDGRRTLEEIAADVGVPVRILVRIAEDLDKALLLDSQRYRDARKASEESFARAEIRPASHAGGAYPADPVDLRDFIDEACASGVPSEDGVIAIIAPHIDPRRGKDCYGAAYAPIGAGPPADGVTVVLLGTSHAPMKEPFALCRKSFDTPLGVMRVDEAAVDAIAAGSPFDPYADTFNHKREHSLEFQAVFLRHVCRRRQARIVPILCGLSDCQRTGKSPGDDSRADQFIRAVRAVCEARRGHTIVIAGADLSHVGPRFGDPAAYDEAERRTLEVRDRESLELAAACAHGAFFAHVQKDLETRRVCGLGPIYTLLRLLPDGSRGSVTRYEQTVDAGDGSIVSHAAVRFYAG